MQDKKINQKKRKADALSSDKTEFKEFKGIKSLSDDLKMDTVAKKQKLDIDSNEEVCDSNQMVVDSNQMVVDSVNEKDNIHKPKKYVIITNLPDGITSDDIKSWLSENNINCNNFAIKSNSDLAVAKFKTEKDQDKLFNVCQGIQYKSNQLDVFRCQTLRKGEQVESEPVCNFDVNSVHLKNLDETIDESMIGQYIVDKEAIVSLMVNCQKKIGIVKFNNPVSAKEFLDKMNGTIINDKTISASFLLKSQRPETFIIAVSNLPKKAKKSEIKVAFPKASKIKIDKTKTCNCLVYFKNQDDYEESFNRENVCVNDVEVSIKKIVTKLTKPQSERDWYILNVFNLPFDLTIGELKSLFQSAKGYHLNRNAEGSFTGSATIKYDDKGACEFALKEAKGIKIRERKVRTEMKIAPSEN